MGTSLELNREMKLLPLILAFLAGNEARRSSRRKRLQNNSLIESRLGVAKLGWSLTKKYMGEGNVVSSPLSIAGALHMLAAGAAGDTRYQICEKGLGLNPEIFGTRKGVSHKALVSGYNDLIDDLKRSMEKAPKVLSIFNALYVADELTPPKFDETQVTNPMYKSILKKDYITKNGEIKTLDFKRDPKAQEEYINNKVSEVTNGMIDHIIDGLDDSTLSVIISAMYYENKWPETLQWEKPTDGEQKSEPDVYCFAKDMSSPCQKDVVWLKTKNYMGHGIFTYYDHEKDVTFLSIPQRDGAVSGVKYQYYLNIIMPSDMSTVSNWEWNDVNDLVGKAIENPVEDVGVIIPEFQIEFKKNLNVLLQEMGVTLPFNQLEADLSFMLPNNPDAYVRHVNHAAMIKVTKEGVKAAAATAIDVKDRSSKSETTKVVINKPFLFTISLAKERNRNSKSEDASIQTHLFMRAVSKINKVQD